MHGSPLDIAADLDTPVSAFKKLAPLRPRYLLESVEGGDRLGRYSFIGFGEGMELRLQAGRLVIDGVEQPVPDSTDALLDLFRDALARAPQPGPVTDEIPFHGGLVGLTSYDLVRRLERVRPAPGRVDLDQPEAAYVAPKSLLVFDHVTRRAGVLHAGSEAERAQVRTEVVRLLRGGIPPSVPQGGLGAPRTTFDRAAYCTAVAKVAGHIHAGDVFQLVLSLRLEGECELDPFEVYRALRLLNPSPYMYYCDIGGLQVVGSSPEALVRLEGRTAWLRPIAGTRPRGANPSEDAAHAASLMADPKELAEHVMLVDLGRNDLGRVAQAGSVQVDPYRVIEKYSHVMHTVSGVTGTLRPGLDAFDLFAAAFPAGTVSGAPKVRAMELIDGLEPVRRGLYAGTVGYFGHGGNMDQAIAIRTLVFQGGRYMAQAGAGIVADSVPEREYEECHAKAAALVAALELAREGL